MSIRFAAAFVFVLIGTVCAADTTSSLAWISGHWCAASRDEHVEELWLPPRGNMLLGVSRAVATSGTVAFEYLRIVESEGILRYVAQPGGRPPTVFQQTGSGTQWIRFENPDHDFPQRIEYRLDGDMLHAEIAGPGEDGKETVIPFDYRHCDW